METSLGAVCGLVLVFQMTINRQRFSFTIVFLVCSTQIQDKTPSPRTDRLILNPKGAERQCKMSFNMEPKLNNIDEKSHGRFNSNRDRFEGRFVVICETTIEFV